MERSAYLQVVIRTRTGCVRDARNKECRENGRGGLKEEAGLGDWRFPERKCGASPWLPKTPQRVLSRRFRVKWFDFK